MPVHDWSQVDPNLFHEFHQLWAVQIHNALNAGLLPPGFSALVEQRAGGLEPDVLAVQRRTPGRRPEPAGGVLTVEPPTTRHVIRGKPDTLAARGNRVAIRHRLGEVVCIIEIVSHSNKKGRAGLRSFVEKAHEFLAGGVNLLILDILPPTARAPHGIHKAIWDDIEEVPFELPPDQPLVMAAYVAADPAADRDLTAYVEPVAVGAQLPSMPAYLDSRHHVPVPLEATYRSAWETCPADMRYLVEHGRLPGEDDPAAE